MKCRNCNNEITQKKCPICGYNNGYKISIGTILSILFTVVAIFGVVFLFISSIGEMSNAGENAFYGIIMLLSAGTAILVGTLLIPYYIIVLVVSIICDINVKKGRAIQNVIVCIFLMIPVFIAGILFLFLMKDTNQKTFDFPDMKMTIPSNMNRYLFGKDSLSGEVYSGGFVSKDNECIINIGKYKYKEELDLKDNLKNVSDSGNSVDKDTNIKSLYDKIGALDTTSINGKTWSYHKGKYEYIEYRIYGIVINNNLYKIEYESKDKSVCEPLLDKTLDSVKYK